jgi:hypothetical protein
MLLKHFNSICTIHDRLQIKNFQNTLDRAWNEIKMKNRQKISSESGDDVAAGLLKLMSECMVSLSMVKELDDS